MAPISAISPTTTLHEETPSADTRYKVTPTADVAEVSISPVAQAIIDDEKQYCPLGQEPWPIVVSRAKGAHLWSVDGRQYIDFMSAFAVVNQGHCHPRIIAALIEQAQKCTLTSKAFYNDQSSVLCKKLCRLLGFDKAVAMNTGADAIDLAIKLARHWGYTQKGIPKDQALVLAASGNFHGKSLSPLSGSTNDHIKIPYFGPYMPGFGPDSTGHTVRFDDLEDLERVLERDGHRTAAFVIEPVLGYGGCLPLSDGYLAAARKLCSKHNVLLVFDEIQSGFGRAGYLMAHHKEGVQPDLLVVGKALTGGAYAMSMVLGMKEVVGDTLPGHHGSTYSGNPLASAVACTAVDVIVEEKLPERSLALGEQLRERLRAIDSPHIREVTGQGLLTAVNLNEGGRVTAQRVAALMAQRGVILYFVGSRLRLSPPLVIEEQDLWHGVDVLESCLADVAQLDGKIPCAV